MPHVCPKCGHRFRDEEEGEEVKRTIAIPKVLLDRFVERFPQHGALTDAVNGFVEILCELTDVKPEELYALATQALLSSHVGTAKKGSYQDTEGK